MFIQTEKTPNPNSLKFIPDCEVTGGASLEIKDKEDAKEKSELAYHIFALDNVVSVFLAHNFLSVTKTDNINWEDIKPEILNIIMDCFAFGNISVLNDNNICNNSNKEIEYNNEDKVIVEQIQEILKTHVRPAVARDGGDIIFHSYDRGCVYLEMQGACAGCPSAAITLQNGVKNVLQHFIPEVIDIKTI